MSRKVCSHPPCDKEVPDRKGGGIPRKYCSEQCASKTHVGNLRRRRKAQLVEMKGGGCERCGYDRCTEALHFHHDKGVKNFELKMDNLTKPWDLIVAELDLTSLLCANCHAEVHAAENPWNSGV